MNKFRVWPLHTSIYAYLKMQNILDLECDCVPTEVLISRLKQTQLKLLEVQQNAYSLFRQQNSRSSLLFGFSSRSGV